MFSQRILYRLKTSNINITGWNRYDASLQGTIEMLISDRLQPEETFKIRYGSDEETSAYAVQKCENFYISFPRNMREYEDNDVSDYGFVHNTEVENFFKKQYKIKTIVLQHISMRKTCVILFKKTLEAFHLIQCAIPKYFPWIFQDKPLTEDELNFLSGFTTNDYRFYQEFQAKYDDEHRLDVLETLTKNIRENRLRVIRKEIEQVQSNIDDYVRYISEKIVRRRELEEKVYAIANSEEEDYAKKFKEYIAANNNVKVIAVEGSVCVFSIEGVFKNFDTDIARTLVKSGPNNNTFCYVPSNYKDKFLKVFKSVFVDERFKMKCIANFEIDFQSFRYAARRLDNYTNKHIPNPHLHNFRCIGDYYAMLTDAMNRADIIGMLMVMNVSTCSVNLMEYPSCRELCGHMYNFREDKIYIDKDGNEYTFEEVAEIIEREEENNE